jgi:hypothetical protein
MIRYKPRTNWREYKNVESPEFKKDGSRRDDRSFAIV